MTGAGRSPSRHQRAQAFGLCAVISPTGQVCNRTPDDPGTLDHAGEHRWADNGWLLCGCEHAVAEHTPGHGGCLLCGCDGWVRMTTPARPSS